MSAIRVTAAVTILALAGALTACLGVGGCSGKTNVKQDLQTVSSVINAVDQSPACTWVAAISSDPSAGTICKEVLDGLAGASSIASTVAGRRASKMASQTAPPAGYKELRVNGALKGILRPDVWDVVTDLMAGPKQ